jgi:hypothetical protein
MAVPTSSASSVDSSPVARRLFAQEAQLLTHLGTVQAEAAYLRAQLSSQESLAANMETALAAVRAKLALLRS